VARVRLATLGDLDVLARHRRKMFEAMSVGTSAELDGMDRRYRRWARDRLRSGRLVAFVVEGPRGRIAASAGLWLMPLPPRPWTPGDVAPYLMSMYTEREDRGNGYATRLVRAAIRWAKAHGHSIVLLHASGQGRRIYEDLGFTPNSEMRLRMDVSKRTAGSGSRPARRASRHGA
jgi:GNAT superfamily N-acetyltransferase